MQISSRQLPFDRTLSTDSITLRFITYWFSFKEAPVAPDHIYQRLLSGLSRHTRLDKATNKWTSYVRILWIQMKSAWNSPTAEELNS